MIHLSVLYALLVFYFMKKDNQPMWKILMAVLLVGLFFSFAHAIERGTP